MLVSWQIIFKWKVKTISMTHITIARCSNVKNLTIYTYSFVFYSRHATYLRCKKTHQNFWEHRYVRSMHFWNHSLFERLIKCVLIVNIYVCHGTICYLLQHSTRSSYIFILFCIIQHANSFCQPKSIFNL